MLHNPNASTVAYNPQQDHGWERTGPGPFDVALGFLRRHYLLIAITTVVSLVASFTVLKLVPPTYSADVKIMLGSAKPPVLQPQPVQDDPPLDMESQIEILKSKSVATAVISKLNLADDPDFSGKASPLHGVMGAIRRLVSSTPEPSAPSMDDLLEEFQRRMNAFRIGTSTVVEVDFTASDPQRAAMIANAIVKEYFDQQLKAEANEQRTVTAWLHDRLQELGNDATSAERAVNDLKSRHNIVSADGRFVDQQQITELTNRLVAARTHTSSLMTRLNRFDEMLASSTSDSPVDSFAAVSDFAPAELSGNLNPPDGLSISNSNSTAIINSLRQQYLDNAKREYEYAAKYGSDHLAVINIRAAMKSIRQAILDEVRRLADVAKHDYAEARQQQQEVEKQLAQAVVRSQDTMAAEISIRELETSAKGYRALYDTFLQRYMGSVQQGSFPIAKARVISAATPPKKKIKPKSLVLLGIGLFGGLAFGGGLGLLRELRDRSFRTTDQLEDRLRLPCLSVVPLLRQGEVNRITSKAALGAAGKADAECSRRMMTRGTGACWAASAMPSSRFAESIRSLKVAIDQDPNRTARKVLGLTSALPNEGKSMIAASLAQSIASSGKRVIVIDCDLRNPSLSATLAPDAGTGIADIVSGARLLEETVWTDPATRLDFLPGKGAAHRDTSDILANEQMRKLFEQLRASYDYIIVDLPPLAPVADARAISGLLDSFVLVVEWGRTPADVVEHALNTAPNVYDALLGVVLNKTDMKALKRYANHFGDYYNHRYYARYGSVMAE
ncbi:chromosome partitioning protein ParA [Bradyrhizobium sp. SSBR45G]|uniref:polysaccharide biosynthesis tyrosine autokinase n=1 Tax=unclassified Bradyrhizobium TaxID=2631580 RepID=UPI00234296CD|nr:MULTISPECIES: polysaccharide biosynthesis tyrosine autokinase [unclassified Bradyrhizobium]GLH79962.1 chromosome partitioning protein ParA [Bradyrhizobium sp. SSBR45G]GLH87338.1 chromosome partitioning protein ParA [Bradyrhizobium sp. SSBR45R]